MDAPGDLERLLVYLRTSRGFDFSSYKRTTLGRRIDKRMQAVGVATYDAYQDFLEVHQDEFPQLFNTVLINVTSFFRDPEAWAYVRDSVIPVLLKAKGEDAPIRVWVAGCASGEEACTLAILLAEALGREAFRERVKIYATDLDEDALAASRAALYTERDLEAVPEPLRAAYFERTNGHFTFDRDLRRLIIFGRLDLIADAPISRVDLLTCRNTLMYFNAEVQDRILQRFHFALADGGFLVLGRAETMLSHNELYATVDLKNRVFAKVARDRARDRSFMFAVKDGDAIRVEGATVRLREVALDGGKDAQILLDLNGRVAATNERARILFNIGKPDLGSPIQDLDVSFRPVELRAGIEQAMAQRRAVRHKGVGFQAPSGEALTFDVAVSPLKNEAGEVVGTGIVFEDVTALKMLQGELQSFKQELETAYEEVQSTNEELQTTNEELQSTVEELETTNEELQSTNEELETMNEELQSANEELETMNEELRGRSDELNHANGFLESVLAGLREGVIVVDGDLRVLAWNHGSEDLWGLRPDEVRGKHLLNLDIGLPVDEFRAPVRACLATGEMQTVQISAVNRRGRPVECGVVFTPLRGPLAELHGVIVLTSCANAG